MRNLAPQSPFAFPQRIAARHAALGIPVVCLLALTLLAGCRVGIASPRRYYPDGTPVSGGGDQGGAVPSAAGLAPLQQLNVIDQHLRSQGQVPVGSAIRNPNMAEGGLIAYAVNGQPGACYTTVALGHEGQDLNMVVMDPQGERVGYNVDPTPHPWASFCASEPGRYTVRLQMDAGSGEYYYATYQGPRAVELASLFGDGQDDASATVATLDEATAQRVRDLDETLGSENMMRVGEPHGQQYAARERREYALSLTPGRCYAFAAFGGPGTQDTDLILVDGEGRVLTRDNTRSVDALVRYCPQTESSYRLQARVGEGEGALFTASYMQQPASDAASAEAPQATAPVIETSSRRAANLDETFRLLNADMQARGYTALGAVARGELDEGGNRDFAIEFEGDKCYALLAVGDDNVRNLDLVLRDPNGRDVDQDLESDAKPIVRVCPERSGTFNMRIQMREGGGNFIYATYKWPRGTHGPFGLSGLIYVRLAEVTSLLSVEGYEPDIDATPGKGRLRRPLAQVEHDIELSHGSCYSILVVGGDGVHDLGAQLSRGGSTLASDGTRTAFPSLRHCPEQTGRYRLTVKAEQGSGEYFYQIFRRTAD